MLPMHLNNASLVSGGTGTSNAKSRTRTLGDGCCWEWNEVVSEAGGTVRANSLGAGISMKRDGPTALGTQLSGGI